MNISKDEQDSIKVVLEAGSKYGYGNMILHLQTAWAKYFMECFEFDELSARKATACSGDGYPFALQDDLIERGFWDETGESYRKVKK